MTTGDSHHPCPIQLSGDLLTLCSVPGLLDDAHMLLLLFCCCQYAALVEYDDLLSFHTDHHVDCLQSANHA